MRMYDIWYLVASLLSGIIELGSVFFGIRNGYEVPYIISLALAYQLGNILRFLVSKKIADIQNTLLFCSILLSCSLFILSGGLKFAVCFILFTLISTMLQNIRSSLQGNIPRWKKRSCRVIGFSLSAFVYVFPNENILILSSILFVISIHTPKFYYVELVHKWKNGDLGRRFCLSMITHQAHYFAYNYIMIILSMDYFRNPFIVSAWFIANWIPYTITEPMVKKLKWCNWKRIALFAHVFNAVVLFGMCVCIHHNIYITLILWIFTGFGGGNVFCIKKSLEKKVKYDKKVWMFSEQIGHILGVMTALIISLIGLHIEYSLIMASIFALITIPVMTMSLKMFN